MATGILGAAQTASSVVSTVYTVPSGKTASLTINICNTSDISLTLNYLAISPNSSPTASEYIEYNQLFDAGQVLERSGIVLGAGSKVLALSSGALSINVYGYEE